MRLRRCEISAQQVPLGDIEMGFASRLRLRPDQIEGVLRGTFPQEQFNQWQGPRLLNDLVQSLASKFAGIGFKICNVFHAGDGNLHPLVLFDAFKPGQYEAVLRIGDEILKLCADAGGSVTGEHGIGLEKRENIRYVFSDVDLAVMDQVRRVFDPQRLMNPGKVFPGDGLAHPRVPTPDGQPRRQPRASVAKGEDIWV